MLRSMTNVAPRSCKCYGYLSSKLEWIKQRIIIFIIIIIIGCVDRLRDGGILIFRGSPRVFTSLRATLHWHLTEWPPERRMGASWWTAQSWAFNAPEWDSQVWFVTAEKLWRAKRPAFDTRRAVMGEFSSWFYEEARSLWSNRKKIQQSWIVAQHCCVIGIAGIDAVFANPFEYRYSRVSIQYFQFSDVSIQRS